MNKHLYHIQKIHERELLKKKNVVSVGVGRKYKNGNPTDKMCIVVGVSRKEQLIHLVKSDMIPASLQDVDTDVFELGEIVAQSDEEIDPTKRIHPVRPGVSISHGEVTAGTAGCVVYRNNIAYILSNNHVVSNTNEAKIGDPIYQPGRHDDPNGVEIGLLAGFIPIVFEGVEPPETDPEPDPEPPKEDNKSGCPIASFFANILNFGARQAGSDTVVVPVNIKPLVTDNEIDAGLVRPTVDISPEIVQIGVPKGVTEPVIDMGLKKYGRTTKFTVGTIRQIGATVSVGYGNGKSATFINQIIATGMSQGGDSGSLVLSEDNKAVGLLFAGSTLTTVINPIKTVLEKLNVKLEK